MEEKKNIKKTTSQTEEIPSQGKIIGAWILLIFLIACTAGLIYLKNNHKPELQQEENKKPEVPQIITTTLTSIADNFNKSTIVADYKKEGLTLNATVKDMTITVTYTTSEKIQSIDYVYTVANANIVANTKDDTKEINNKIFKAMVLACRESKDYKEDVTSEIDEFINNNKKVYGLKKETTNNNTTYYIDIRYPAATPPPSQTTTQNTTTQESITE